MEIQTALMLGGAGVFGGALAGLIGGASLITFPALLAAGLPPIIATTTNLIALMPANVAAGLTERARLPALDRAFAGLVLASVLGALAGAALLLLTPARLFELLVPLLLGFATLLFACSARISVWLRQRMAAGAGPAAHFGPTSIPVLLPVSVYGGYFGAGVGVLVLAVLSVATGGDYRAANVTKNVVVLFNSVAAAALFIVQGAVNWPAAVAMAGGALIGGVLAGQLARVVPPGLMRFAIIGIGALLTAVYAWRYWF